MVYILWAVCSCSQIRLWGEKIYQLKGLLLIKHGRRGLSFVYLSVRLWKLGWLPFSTGWEMQKAFEYKNCLYLPSASPLLLKTAPSFPYHYGYHRNHHSGTAELHTVATADWSRSIHLTQVEPIKILFSHFGSERGKAVTVQMAAFPQYGKM